MTVGARLQEQQRSSCAAGTAVSSRMRAPARWSDGAPGPRVLVLPAAPALTGAALRTGNHAIWVSDFPGLTRALRRRWFTPPALAGVSVRRSIIGLTARAVDLEITLSRAALPERSACASGSVPSARVVIGLAGSSATQTATYIGLRRSSGRISSAGPGCRPLRVLGPPDRRRRFAA